MLCGGDGRYKLVMVLVFKRAFGGKTWCWSNLTAIREQSWRREERLVGQVGANTVTSACVHKIVSIYHVHPDLATTGTLYCKWFCHVNIGLV